MLFRPLGIPDFYDLSSAIRFNVEPRTSGNEDSYYGRVECNTMLILELLHSSYLALLEFIWFLYAVDIYLQGYVQDFDWQRNE